MESHFCNFVEAGGIPADVAPAWNAFVKWADTAWGPPGKLKDIERAAKFATPELVEFLADTFRSYLVEPSPDYKFVAYALWPVIASHQHDEVIWNYAERHFGAPNRAGYALVARRYVAWRDKADPSPLLQRLDSLADRPELTADPVRRFAEAVKLKFEPREPWHISFFLTDDRLKSLTGPRPRAHPTLAVDLRYPSDGHLGWSWSLKLVDVFGGGEVVWRQGAREPETFSRDSEIEARLKNLPWPAAREPLDLPLVVSSIEKNLSLRFDREKAPYLKKSENNAVTAWLGRALAE